MLLGAVMRVAVKGRSRILLPSRPSIMLELALKSPLHEAKDSIRSYLGNPFRRHEGACLHVGDASFCKSIDEFYLGLQWYGLLLVLQAISWPDLHEACMVCVVRSRRAKVSEELTPQQRREPRGYAAHCAGSGDSRGRTGTQEAFEWQL
jgi:hypothetical protein